jgi:hypothetical protein
LFYFTDFEFAVPRMRTSSPTRSALASATGQARGTFIPPRHRSSTTTEAAAPEAAATPEIGPRQSTFPKRRNPINLLCEEKFKEMKMRKLEQVNKYFLLARTMFVQTNDC